MAVVIETTLGDVTVDLFLKERPRACQNFLKLCKMKYYNYNLFHTVSRGFIAQTGDPTGSRNGGESIFGVLEGPLKRFFVAETNPRIKHTIMGLISFVGNEENMIGSQFFFTLGDELTYLDGKHCVFGQVTEGLDVLELINEAICDSDDRPYQDIRITHTVVLDDPVPDLERMVIPSRSPSPSAERLQGGRIAPDEEIDETAGKSMEEINEIIAEREAKARAAILEMVGDLPDADMAPPENVLFICKLNPVTTDDDLEIIFSRFGKIKSCEVIRDHKTGDSLQYAFVEFEEQKSCEDAYFKMDNVLIDDRRIHVDFSQSVSKIKWMGKGRGVKHFDEKVDSRKNNRDHFKGTKNYGRSYSRSPESRRINRRNSSTSKVPERNSYHNSRYKNEVSRKRRSKSPQRDKYRYDDKTSYYHIRSPQNKRTKNEKVSRNTSYIKFSDDDNRKNIKGRHKNSLEDSDSKSRKISERKSRNLTPSISPRRKRDKKDSSKKRVKSSSPPKRSGKEQSKKYKKRDSSSSASSSTESSSTESSSSSSSSEHRKKSFERNSKRSRSTADLPQRSRKKKPKRSSSSSSDSYDEKRVEKRRDNDYNKSFGTKKGESRKKLRSPSCSPPIRKSKKEKHKSSRSDSPRRRK